MTISRIKWRAETTAVAARLIRCVQFLQEGIKPRRVRQSIRDPHATCVDVWIIYELSWIIYGIYGLYIYLKQP